MTLTTQTRYPIPVPDLTPEQRWALFFRVISSLRVMLGALVLMVIGGLILSTFGVIVGLVGWYGVMLIGALSSGTLFNYSVRHRRNLSDAELVEFNVALQETRAYKAGHR